MASIDPRTPTRARILDAAVELFGSVGFAGTTISEVERRVGLAAGTGSFYRHFDSKEALLHAAVAREVERCLSASEIERAGLPEHTDPRAQFTETAGQILRDMRRFDRLFRMMLIDGERLPDVRDTINAALAQRHALSFVDDPTMLVAVAALMGFHMFEHFGGGLFDTVDQDRFIASLAVIATGD